MRSSSRLLKQNLFDVAELQGGYFNAAQAIRAGYTNPTHVYHVKTGDWIRVDRGIYRLAHYPSVYSREDLIVLFLWSANREGIPQGTFSYQTALDILGGTDIMPPKVHMTVPKGFRRNAVPPLVLKLHYENLGIDEVETREGIRLTTPKKTLEDLYITETIDRKMWLDARNFLLGKSTPQLEKWLENLQTKKQTQSSRNYEN